LSKTKASLKVIVGVFMSPFDMHHNRAPLIGLVENVIHSPAQPRKLHMGAMHWRSLLNRLPLYRDSLHIIQNSWSRGSAACSKARP
jgi:phosphatidylserine decarboxylase